MNRKTLFYLANGAALLAFFVVMLGAYTRLTNAGLGCPDWPGCYGHMTGLGAPEPTKAWTEMIHRYLAGCLALLTIVLASVTFIFRKRYRLSMILPLALIGVILFQALLGMWTVTLKLLPVVVMGHLLGGLTTLSLLWLLRLNLQSAHASSQLSSLKPWVVLSLIVVIVQIALGGWVSSNYAGLSCVGFPLCNGEWHPHLQFSQAFAWSTVGANFQGGILNVEQRMAIQMVHRAGALVTSLLLLYLIIRLWKLTPWLALSLAAILLLQISLGIINVVFLLPLPAAVLHNSVGALLLLCMMTVTYYVFKSTSDPHE